MKLRVLRLSTGLFPIPPKIGGAVERYVYHLSNAMANLGVEEHIVSDVEKDAQFSNRITVHRVFTPPFSFKAGFYGWAIGFLVGSLSVLETTSCTLVKSRSRFDLIHSHDLLSTFLLIIFKRVLNLRIPILFTVHGSVSRKSHYVGLKRFVINIGRSIELCVWKNVDCLVVLGEKPKKELIHEWQIEPAKIAVIEQGVDTSYFHPSLRENEKVRKKYGIPGDYCLFVGRLSPLKGPQYLIQAVKGISICCVLVGDGPYKEELHTLVEHMGVSDRVFFTGMLPFSEVKELYSGARFFILPSLKEGSPLVILEAMSCGLPVISTDVAGIPDVVKEGYNGFIVPHEDVDALNKRLTFLAGNRDVLRLIGENARQTALEHDWKRIAEKHVRLYNRIQLKNSA